MRQHWRARIKNPHPDKQFRCKHHIVNRSNGGTNHQSNLLRLWKEKEEMFHLLFGDKTLIEAARLLLRVHRAKKKQRRKAA